MTFLRKINLIKFWYVIKNFIAFIAFLNVSRNENFSYEKNLQRTFEIQKCFVKLKKMKRSQLQA